MNTNETILGTIDPEITERLVTRREAIRKGAAVSSVAAAGLAMASIPVALAALSREAFGQTLPANIKAVLDFALNLEIFENEFYKAVLGTSGRQPFNTAFAPVRAQVQALPNSAAVLAALGQIQKHEAAHVAFLQAQGATSAITVNDLDFTGGRGSGTGPFARATSELAFLLATAQAAEDTGVAAYKGQAPNLISSDAVLEAALRIHSVEARHAAKIRRLRRATATPAQTVLRYSGTISGGDLAAAGVGNISNPPAEVAAALTNIYQNEENTTHADVNVATLSFAGVPNFPTGASLTAAATEAFDEPLTRAQVIAIVQPFFVPTLT